MTLLFVSSKDLVLLFLTYKPMINPLISRCRTPLPTILPLNKVHYRASSEVYGALEQPPLRFMEPLNSLPLIETRFSGVLKQSTPSVWHLSHFWLDLRISQLLCSTFEDSIDMAKLRVWLKYYVRDHEPPQWYDIVHFEPKLLSFWFWFPQKVSYQWR